MLDYRQIQVLRGVVAARPARKYGEVAVELARAHGIGRLQGAGVVYEAEDFLKAANLLRLQSVDLAKPSAGALRREGQTGVSEKIGARSVGAGLVAVVPLNAPLSLPQGARFLVADGDQLDLATFEVILVVENLEPFSRQEMDSYGWLQQEFLRGRPTLALWRGGPGPLGTAAPAALLRRAVQPVLGFYDFDPKGLTFAASAPRLDALCLPPWELLQEQVRRFNREDLWYGQVDSSRAQLDRLQAGPLQEAWQRMQQLRCGLPQEQFPRLREGLGGA